MMNNVSCSNEEIHVQEIFKSSVKSRNNNMNEIHQFLLDHNLQETAQHFVQEASSLGYINIKDFSDNEHRYITGCYEKLLFIFKSGNRPEFFKVWNYIIPESMRESKEYKILTLNLHVHFALLPRRMLLFCRNKSKCPTSSTSLKRQDTDLNETEEQNFTTEMDKNANEGMMQLLQYLTTDGKELEHEIQLRPFFALPYIEDPLAEPFLSKVFNKDWLNELTTNLETFIAKCKQNLKLFSEPRDNYVESFHKASLNEEVLSPDMEVSHNITPKNNIPIVPNDRNIPMFVEDNDLEEQIKHLHKRRLNMQSKYTQTCYLQTDSFETVAVNKRLIQYNEELASARSHFNTVQCNYKKLNARFHKLHTDYHKLISVAGELTAALDNSFRGQPVDLQKTLETCIKIFPELFSRNIRDDLQFTSLPQLDNPEIMNSVQPTLDIVPASPHMLDFKKIKLHLMNGGVKTKLYLLQALRWKLTLTQPAERDEVIHEYITSDLLGLHGQIASDNGKSILPYLLTPGFILIPHPLQQSTTRLLNALASVRCGRDYLSAGPIVVDVIFKCLNTNCENGIDAYTWDMMIATLQKLSLRKQQRMYMIETGMVEWLVYHLHSESRRMSSYRLEYATALLMNLSLHRQAQIRASAIASIVISTVLGLLSVDNMPALSYVNGALNNFLSNRVINDEAKKMKLSSILEYYRKQKTGEIRKHLDHILKIHKGEYTNNTEDDETADDDNEDFDVIESQLEEDDPVKNHSGELFGDTLLATCYTVLPSTYEAGESITEDAISLESKIKNIQEYRRATPETSFSQVFQHYPDTNSSNNINATESVSEKTMESTIASNNTSGQPLFATNRSESTKQYVSKFKLQKGNANETSNKSLKSNSIKYRNYSEDALYLYTNDSSEEGSKMTITSSSLTLAVASNARPACTVAHNPIECGLWYDSDSVNLRQYPDSHVIIEDFLIKGNVILTEVERFSSIASLNLSDDNKFPSTTITKNDTELDKEGEEAFLAKPKLSRTPP